MYGCAHQYTGKSIQRTQSDKGDSLNGGNSLNALSDRIVPDRAKGVKRSKGEENGSVKHAMYHQKIADSFTIITCCCYLL